MCLEVKMSKSSFSTSDKSDFFKAFELFKTLTDNKSFEVNLL